MSLPQRFNESQSRILKKWYDKGMKGVGKAYEHFITTAMEESGLTEKQIKGWIKRTNMRVKNIKETQSPNCKKHSLTSWQAFQKKYAQNNTVSCFSSINKSASSAYNLISNEEKELIKKEFENCQGTVSLKERKRKIFAKFKELFNELESYGHHGFAIVFKEDNIDIVGTASTEKCLNGEFIEYITSVIKAANPPTLLNLTTQSTDLSIPNSDTIDTKQENFTVSSCSSSNSCSTILPIILTIPASKSPINTSFRKSSSTKPLSFTIKSFPSFPAIPAIIPSPAVNPQNSTIVTPSLSANPFTSSPITPSLSANPFTSSPITPSLSANPFTSSPITPSLSANPFTSLPITPSLSTNHYTSSLVTPSLSTNHYTSSLVTPSLSATSHPTIKSCILSSIAPTNILSFASPSTISITSSGISSSKLNLHDQLSSTSNEPDYSATPIEISSQSPEETDSSIWIANDSICLHHIHKKTIQDGSWLPDIIIDAVQELLKRQSPSINGWQTPQLGKGYNFTCKTSPFIQILHVHGNHWIVASTINCKEGEVNIYDSLYSYIHQDTKLQICSIVRPNVSHITFRSINFQRQTNSKDCGLFAITVATELVLGRDPARSYWQPKSMRDHLINCLESLNMSKFPSKYRSIPRGAKMFKTIQKEEVFCICRMINNPEKGMINCNRCNKWYHIDCVNVDLKEKKWFCVQCLN